MAVGVLATITVAEGKNAEFEQAFLALVEQVRANEPGNIFYILHRSKADPQVYKEMEQHHSAADLDTHAKSAHFREANKVLATLVAGPAQVEVLEVV
jgi:quinol monooxygenase YgiN